MNVLIIAEDPVKDRYMLEPIVAAMLKAKEKTRAKVKICEKPRLRGVAQALDRKSKCGYWPGIRICPKNGIGRGSGKKSTQRKPTFCPLQNSTTCWMNRAEDAKPFRWKPQDIMTVFDN